MVSSLLAKLVKPHPDSSSVLVDNMIIHGSSSALEMTVVIAVPLWSNLRYLYKYSIEY